MHPLGMEVRSGLDAPRPGETTIDIEKRRGITSMKRSWMGINLVALLLVAAVGCSRAPQDEISAAQAELDRARQANAETWAPTEYKAADEAMTAAQAEIAAQGGKFIKSYDKAKELLAKVKEEAARAAEAAVANKEQTRKDAEAALGAADTALQAAEASLKVAPVSKDSKADLALYRTDIETLRGTLDEARQAFSSEDYKKALESATSVKDKATTIADDLEAAKRKRMGVRR